MKALIIYDSTFGNTEHVAQAIAQKLREHGSVQLVPVEEAGRLELKETHLLLLGCPTQRYDLTPAVRAFLENIPRGTLQGVMAAAFDTRYQALLLGTSPGTFKKRAHRSSCHPRAFSSLVSEAPWMRENSSEQCNGQQLSLKGSRKQSHMNVTLSSRRTG